MAYYTEHTVRYRGRLIAITARNGCFVGGGGPRIVRGKKLDLRKGSIDYKKIEDLFYRRPADVEDPDNRGDSEESTDQEEEW